MATDDKKSPKGPKRIVFSLKAKSLNQVLGGTSPVEGRIGDTVHVYGPIKKSGSSKQRIISRLTSQFEHLLLTGSEETLRNALNYLDTLQAAKPAPPSSLSTNFVILRHSDGGKLIIEEDFRKSVRIKTSSMVSGGTGSTGPGGKPKGKK